MHDKEMQPLLNLLPLVPQDFSYIATAIGDQGQTFYVYQHKDTLKFVYIEE